MFGWSVVFQNKPRDSRWRTKRVANTLEYHECGRSEGMNLSRIELNTVQSIKIKGKFVLAFHVTDNSTEITINFGPKEALRKAKFDELLLSFFGKRQIVALKWTAHACSLINASKDKL